MASRTSIYSLSSPYTSHGVVSISSAILTSELSRRLDAIPGLPNLAKDAVGESIAAVSSLPALLKTSVENAYVGAVKDVFLLVVVGAMLASLSALLVSRKKVNVKI